MSWKVISHPGRGGLTHRLLLQEQRMLLGDRLLLGQHLRWRRGGEAPDLSKVRRPEPTLSGGGWGQHGAHGVMPDDGDGSSVVVAVVGLAVLAVVVGAHALAED